MFDLGSMTYVIEVDDKGALKAVDSFDKKMDGATKSTEKFGKTAKSTGSIFKGAMVLAVVAGVAKIGKSLLLAASDAEEVKNKFDVTFSSVASEADIMAKNLASSYGLSRKESQKLLADSGDLLSGFGFTQEKALGLSNEVNKLAADLGSFQNLETADVSARITSALTGEVESMKSLGVVIKQGSTEFKTLVTETATAQGITETQAKSLVILDEITKQSANSIGDFARSQSSFANQSKIAEANIGNLKETLGKSLLPVAGVAIGMFNDLTGELEKGGEAFNKFLSKAENAKKIGDAIGFIAGYFTTIKKIGTGYLMDIIEAFKLILGPLTSMNSKFDVMQYAIRGLNAWISVLGGVLKIAGTYIGGLISMYIQFGNSIFEVIKSLKNFKTVWEGIVEHDPKKVAEGFKAMGNVGFDEIKKSLGSVKKVFVDTGNVAVEEGKKVVDAFMGEGKELATEYEKTRDEAAKKTLDGLVAEQEGYDKSVKANAKKNQDQLDNDEETADKKISLLSKVAEETENYAGQAMDFLNSLNDIKNNVDEADIEQKERDLEIQKQIWDAEAEAEIDALDESVLGTEEYNAQMEAIEDANDKRQLQADYDLQMAKYDQEVDAFKRSQALAIAQIWINQAVATMKAFAEMGWIGGLIVAAATSTIAIAQTAAVATQPAPVAPVKPAFAEGGIVNNPGMGVDAIVGEAGPEAILPLNDSTMKMLGSAIVEANSGTTERGSGLSGNIINVIIEGMGKATINLTQEALNNRTIRVPVTALG